MILPRIIIFTGALLFGQLNNRIQEKAAENLYARGFKGHPMGMIAPPAPKPIPTFRKRRLRNRFRKRRLPAYIKTTYSQRHGRLPVGGRRRLRKNFQTRGEIINRIITLFLQLLSKQKNQSSLKK